MRPALSLAPLVVFLLASVASIATAEEPVHLDSGDISGTVSSRDGSDVRVYKGIPFAAPPVGPLRWKPPEKPASWPGVRACTSYGASCPQTDMPFMSVGGAKSEDCLFLNVWTPAKSTDAKLPVMVWIHGGGFAFGSSAQDGYDGEALARRGVVLVTINYRLGPFGFLAHPALAQESARKSSGNYGLLDQIAALEWVKRNVAAFGGDPGCVTVFGESAGGMSVSALLISPLAQGLFHRAIAESGVCSAPGLTPKREVAEKAGERFAAALDCRGSDAEVTKALRAKSAEELLGAVGAAAGPTSESTFFPDVDGWVIPEDPLALVLTGKAQDVPLLLGTTKDEGTVFVAGTPPTIESFRAFVTENFGAEAPRVLERYGPRSDDEVHKARARLLRDGLFVAPTRIFARSREGFRSKTFLYQFTRVSPGAKTFGIGAHHAAEVPYVFEALDKPGVFQFTDADRALSKTIARAWVRFAKTGDPNGEGLAEWPAYSRENDAHLELGDHVKVGTRLLGDDCDFLESVWKSLAAPEKKTAKRWY